jgi:HTH-type transcriptional regulator / antitoxin HigA
METVKEATITNQAITSVIKTEAEYDELLAEFRLLVMQDPAANTPEGDRLALLGLLLQEYEARNFTLGPTDAVDAIVFRMEQMGLKRKDLIPYLGSRSKVSEVLNRKRPLSLTMIRALHAGLDIPLETLIQESADE